MAAGFCLPDKYIMVDVCRSGIVSDIHYTAYNKFSIHKSSDCKPGEELKNRITKLRAASHELTADSSQLKAFYV
jgi:hypothetical protein